MLFLAFSLSVRLASAIFKHGDALTTVATTPHVTCDALTSSSSPNRATRLPHLPLVLLIFADLAAQAWLTRTRYVPSLPQVVHSPDPPPLSRRPAHPLLLIQHRLFTQQPLVALQDGEGVGCPFVGGEEEGTQAGAGWRAEAVAGVEGALIVLSSLATLRVGS